MSRQRILLERFDPPSRPEDPADGGAGDAGEPVADLADDMVPAVAEISPEPDAEPDHYHDPGPTLERIADLLEACLANAIDLRRSAERAAADAFGRAAEAVIPVLAGRGFAEEIAAAARALATGAAPQEIVLDVSAEELEGVSKALEERGATGGIRLRTSPHLGPGQAEVAWADGGAEIDVERLTTEALRILEQHLAG